MRPERREAGEELRMKEPYGEGLATHTGPESCVWHPQGSKPADRGADLDQRQKDRTVQGLERPEENGLTRSSNAMMRKGRPRYGPEPQLLRSGGKVLAFRRTIPPASVGQRHTDEPGYGRPVRHDPV